ncbi:MAG: hypothetical protein ACOYLP_10610, partial [Flavobacterium sp.]
MLEEKNDNLLEADGSVNDESQQVSIAENQEFLVENQEETETLAEVETDVSIEEDVVEEVTEAGPELEAAVEKPANEEFEEKVGILTEPLTEDELEVAAETEALVEETVVTKAKKTKPKAETEVKEATVELTEEHVTNSTLVDDLSINDQEQQNDNQSVINAIEEVNAEESEDETLKDRYDIPMQDYDTLSMEQLVDELGELVLVEKLMSVKDHVEELKKSFLSKYHHFIDEKKEEFHAENPETTEDFHYHFPLKVKFDQLYSQYRDKKNNH